MADDFVQHIAGLLPVFRRRSKHGTGKDKKWEDDDWQEVNLLFRGTFPRSAIFKFPRGGAIKIVKGVVDPQDIDLFLDEILLHPNWFIWSVTDIRRRSEINSSVQLGKFCFAVEDRSLAKPRCS